MHVGAPPPREPPQLLAGKTLTDTWQEKRLRFAAYIVANFVPWEHNDDDADACRPRPLTAEVLAGWQRHLRGLARDERDSQERTIARGRLFGMRQYVNALTVDNTLKLAQAQWRGRNRTTWPKKDEEKDGEDGGAEGTKVASPEDYIADLIEGQRSAVVDPERVTRLTEQLDFVDATLAGMGLELPPTKDSTVHTPVAGAGALDPSSCGVINCSAADVDRRSTSIASSKDDDDPGQRAQGSKATASGTGTGTGAGRSEPAEFMPVSDKELEGLVKRWEDDKEQAKKAGLPPPPPPLGHEQREVTHSIYPVLAEIQRAKDSAGPNASRKQYMAMANIEEDDLLVLMSGAAGTGKTEVIKALERVLSDQNLGTLLLTAYTGSAVVTLENAVTLLTLNSWGIDIPHRQEDLGEAVSSAVIERFKQYADLDTLRVLVIDEISFLNATLLQHISRRLQVVLGCPLPFGGLVCLPASNHPGPRPWPSAHGNHS